VTTNFTWRLVFAGETVVVLALMLFLRLIPKTAGHPSKLDLSGAFLSAAGLGLALLAILRSSQWGCRPCFGVDGLKKFCQGSRQPRRLHWRCAVTIG
jgi:hypothetical protein